jgi:hypothetical protein
MNIISFSASAQIPDSLKLVVNAATQTPEETLGIIREAGKVEEGTIIVPIPRSNSALLMIATYWNAVSFRLGLTTLGKDATLVDTLDVQGWRNDVGRTYRDQLTTEDEGDVIVLNAGRKLEPHQAEKLEAEIGPFKEVMILDSYQADFHDGLGILDDVLKELVKVLQARHIGKSVHLVSPGAGQLAVLIGVAIHALTENWPIGVFLEPVENRQFVFKRLEYYGRMVEEGQKLAASWNRKVSMDHELGAKILGLLPEGPEKDALAALLS